MGLSDSTRGVAFLAAVVAIGLVAAGAAVGLPAVEALQQPSGDEILDDVEQRYDDAETVTGTAEVTVSNDSETREATVDFAAKDPDKSWIDVEGEDKSFEAGSNGSVVWAVGEDKSFAREITDEDREKFEMTDPVPDDNVSAERVDTDEIDGESVYVVELTLTDEVDEEYEDVETTLWVSQEDSQVLRIETTGDDKETRIDVVEQQFDVSVHDSTFEPPEDRVSITTTESYESFDDLESATDLDVPSYDDGEFESAKEVSRADGQAVIQEYETDDGTVTIITATGAADRFDSDELEDSQSVTVDGEDATAVERDGRATVFWTEDDVTTGVVVEGDVDDAVAVAEDVR